MTIKKYSLGLSHQLQFCWHCLGLPSHLWKVMPEWQSAYFYFLC